jgi:hypothetical protein
LNWYYFADHAEEAEIFNNATTDMSVGTAPANFKKTERLTGKFSCNLAPTSHRVANLMAKKAVFGRATDKPGKNDFRCLMTRRHYTPKQQKI